MERPGAADEEKLIRSAPLYLRITGALSCISGARRIAASQERLAALGSAERPGKSQIRSAPQLTG